MPDTEHFVPPGPGERVAAARILWDRQNVIPFSNVLLEDDVLLLLTPVVVPPNPKADDTTDPFETLGLSLSKHHSAVRHVPYTKSQGITGVHVAFIRRAKAVIFVITGFLEVDGVSQVGLAEMVAEICEDRPFVVVACCSLPSTDISELDIAGMIHADNFEEKIQQDISSLLFQDSSQSLRASPPDLEMVSHRWVVEAWDEERDARQAHLLWSKAMPKQFQLDEKVWTALLRRSGYAMHLVVRSPAGDELIGFCATYTTFADRSGDRLIGSIAALVVRPDFQRRDIGRMLHDEAVARLNKIRGVRRVQLGSPFPRLLYGIPNDLPASQWFRKRGWEMMQSERGRGYEVADWILRFEDLTTPSVSDTGLSFRPCGIVEASQVIDIVSDVSEKSLLFGWYDQYAKVLDGTYLEDVIIGLDGDKLIAAAITYTPESDSPPSTDIPWPATLGSTMGGITCICIPGTGFEEADRQSTILIQLLHACSKHLNNRGMNAAFLDAMSSEQFDLGTIGLRKWAAYRECWRSL